MASCEPRAVCCRDTDAVQDLALELLADLVAGFEDCESPHCRASLVPGSSLAWDTCCGDCSREGQLSVQVVSIAPRRGQEERCRVPVWEASFRVTSLRCASTVRDDGTPPGAQQLEGDTLKLLRDARVIRDAIECSFAGRHEECGDLEVGAQTFLGPNGGCAGVQQDVTVYVGCLAACGDELPPAPATP